MSRRNKTTCAKEREIVSERERERGRERGKGRKRGGADVAKKLAKKICKLELQSSSEVLLKPLHINRCKQKRVAL